MKKYEVLIEGRNFVIEIDGKEQRAGFYTTRWVEAKDPKEAELKAVAIIKRDPKLKGMAKNSLKNPPMLYLDEIHEVKTFKGIKLPGAGYTFYCKKLK